MSRSLYTTDADGVERRNVHVTVRMSREQLAAWRAVVRADDDGADLMTVLAAIADSTLEEQLEARLFSDNPTLTAHADWKEREKDQA